MIFSRIDGRRRPVDPAQHQEAAVEPGREQMDEVAVDDAQIVAVIHGVEELLAHAHQRRGAAGREIEPAQQFQPARLGGAMQLGGSLRRSVARARPRPPRRCARDHGRTCVASASKKAMRGPIVRSAYSSRISLASATPEASPRPDSSSSQSSMRPAERCVRRLAALAQDQGAAAVRDALQHFAEKGGVHRNSRRTRRK